jgi:hypothetical protein
VFTDHPARIAHRLVRPKTPFVPAPIHLPTSEDNLVDFDTVADAFSDRSPSGDMDDVQDFPASGFFPDAAGSFF